MRKKEKYYIKDTYDYRLMEKFAKLLRQKKINHTFSRKHKTIVIRDGFVTIYKLAEPGIWKAYRIDGQIQMNDYVFILHVNSIQELLIKSARFRLIPYQKLVEMIEK